MQLTARVTDDIIRGTVLAPGIWWNKLSADGHNINQLRPFQETDSLKNMEKAVSNSRETVSFLGNVFLELPKSSFDRF